MNKKKVKTLLKEAKKFLGYPYKWGGSSPKTSFDCSGFIFWVVNNSKIGKMSRVCAMDIYNLYCIPISEEKLQRGDLVFFTQTYKTSRIITHVGIYIKQNMMLHCGESSGVAYISIYSPKLLGKLYAFARLKFMF